MDIGPAEILIVLAVVLLLFGSTKIPQLARSLGQAKSEFEKGARGEKAAPPTDADETVTISKAELDRLKKTD